MGVTSGVWPRVGQTRLHPEQAPQEAGVEGGEGKGESNCLSRVRCPPSGKLDQILSFMGSGVFPTPPQTEEPSPPSRSWQVMTQESRLWVWAGPG